MHGSLLTRSIGSAGNGRGDGHVEAVLPAAMDRTVASVRPVPVNVMERMSLERSAAEQMINSQMPLDEKIRRAHHVVWNNGVRTVLADQARCLVALWQKQSWTTT